MNDIRWKQRFENFSRAFVLLRSALDQKPVENFSDLEQEGLIQRFEYTFELAWKTFKDYLEENGATIAPVTPRQVIKEAYAAKMIQDGQVWMDMMLHRNMLAHTYDFSRFSEVLDAVEKKYRIALEQAYAWLSEKAQEP